VSRKPFDGDKIELFTWFFSHSAAFFSALLCSFFKKRQQEKQSRRPRGDGDDESVEDVDDDEFETLLGKLSVCKAGLLRCARCCRAL